jgi:tRNA(Ile)-lysidine synthase
MVFNQEEKFRKFLKLKTEVLFFKNYQLIVNYDELILKKKRKMEKSLHSNDEILLMENFDFSENQITIISKIY